MKTTKRILSGLLALVMVLMLCPVIALAEEPADVTINIAAMSNGTVTTDKDSYKVGETVTLTVAPKSGYTQKLTINGEPLLLGWKSNTYSFIASESSYEIAGGFEPALNIAFGDGNRWDVSNQAHGVLKTYYPNNNDSWYADIKGEYTSVAITAKNELPIEESYEGNSANGGYRIALRMTLDNGKNYAFSIWIDTGKQYAYNHFGAGSSATGWGGAWCRPAEKNAEATAALNGDGAEFKLERIDGNHMQISLGGTVLETYTIPDVTEANKVVSVGIWQYGMKGRYVDIPFELTTSDVAVNLPAELENGTVTADKESYRKGDTVTLTVAPEAGYFQKLYINGKPLMLDWKTKTYSFVATEDVYDITGSFVRSINHTASDWGRWDDYNQGHNILRAYYPNNNDAWWMTFNGEYQSVTVGVKNYFAIADTKDNFMVVLKVTMDNGHSYSFRVMTDKGGYTAYNRAGIQNPGDASADWGNWKNLSHLDGLITTTGVDFKVERTGDNTLALSVNGAVIDNYTMKGITADNKIASVAVKHQGNKGVVVDVPFYLQAVNAPDATVTIPALENGTVTADKESYKVGDTVNLTIAPNAGYVQKLYINGEPLILGWKTNTYSFVATEKNYEITGSFVPADETIKASDANRWDAANQAHSVMNGYYPSNNDSWWMNFNGNYKSLAVVAKNYWAIADTLDNFMVNLKVTLDNGNVYNFRVFTDKGGYTAYNRAGFKNPGDASADWSHWKNLSKFDSLITTEGVLFKIERTAADTLTLSVNGEVVDTYVMNGITADNKVATVSFQHQGNKGTYVTVPYVLEEAPAHVHTPAEAVKENIVDATCTAVGSYDEVVYCGECNEELSRVNKTISALGHTYEAQTDCSVEVICSVCESVVFAAKDHIYDNDQDADCNVCGATREVGPAKADDLAFLQAPSLSFQDYIGMQVTIYSSLRDVYDEIYVEAVQMDPEKGAVTTKLEGMLYYFDMLLVFDQQILSWSMAENVTLTLYGVKDGKTFVGQSYSASVEDLALGMLASNATDGDAKLCTVLVNMLNYGATVQTTFEHNADLLPNTKIADYASFGTAGVPEMNAEVKISGNGAVASLQDSISMQSKVELQLLFAEDISAYTGKAVVNGVEKNVVFDTESMGAFGWTVVRVAVGAAEMRETFTIALYDAEGNAVTNIYEVSVEAYAKGLLGGTQNDVAVTMMRYGDAVAAFAAD